MPLTMKAARWQRVEFTAVCSARSRSVQGWTSASISGLVVHQLVAEVPSHYWTVSHLLSGRAVVLILPNRVAAEAAAGCLASALDWQLPLDQLLQNRDHLQKIINQVKAEYGGEV